MFIDSVPITLLAALSKPPVSTSMYAPICLTQSSVEPNLIEILNKPPREISSPISRAPKAENKRILDWRFKSNPSVLLSEDSKAVCLHSKCQSCFETVAARLPTPIRPNRVTYWEWHVVANVTGGTSVMFGVCQEETQLESNGYVNLLGGDCNSWALNSHGYLFHNGVSRQYCAPFNDGREHKVACLFNSHTSRLWFFVDGQPMGLAFEQIECGSDALYPVVASTVRQSIFRLDYAVEIYATLRELCVAKIREIPACLQMALEEYKLPTAIISDIYL